MTFYSVCHTVEALRYCRYLVFSFQLTFRERNPSLVRAFGHGYRFFFQRFERAKCTGCDDKDQDGADQDSKSADNRKLQP